MADETMAGIGHNNPPTDPFDGFSTHIEDLLLEARNFLDGAGVQSQDEADGVSVLLDQIRKAAKDADAARVAEKKPHDDAAKAVQSKWKPLLDKAELAQRTCKDTLAPWLRKVEEERRAAADKARAEAEEKARQAAEAMRAAQASDLAAREAAEAQLADAKVAEAAAAKAENAKAHAKGGSRATTLRSAFFPVMTDRKTAVLHYLRDQQDEYIALAQRLAEQDVRAGKRSIPGFEVREERVVV